MTVNSSVGLKCWVCDSTSDSKCADPFDNSTYFITDCDYKTPVSTGNVAICTKSKEQRNGQTYVKRSCGQMPGNPDLTGNEIATGCDQQSNSAGNSVQNCWCRGSDGCNSFPPGGIVNHGQNPNSGFKVVQITTVTIFFGLLTTILLQI